MRDRVVVIILVLLCIVITVVPLITIKDSEFSGADGGAEEIIAELNPNYEPWAESIIVPPGGETESLLFALQAAIGSGVVFGIFGYLKGRKSAGAES